VISHKPLSIGRSDWVEIGPVDKIGRTKLAVNMDIMTAVINDIMTG